MTERRFVPKGQIGVLWLCQQKNKPPAMQVVGEILGSLCRRKGIEIIEAECCLDHIHMLVRNPPKYSVSEIVGYLKGKSSLMI